jgi:hypothetical protein
MALSLFDSTVIQEAEAAINFMANVLESSSEYSIIGKDLDGKILLWNEDSHELYRRYGSDAKHEAWSKRFGTFIKKGEKK